MKALTQTNSFDFQRSVYRQRNFRIKANIHIKMSQIVEITFSETQNPLEKRQKHQA